MRSEQDIIASWQGGILKPLVSICCPTYNHEKFIEDALKGFLIQQTDFPYEILIHDDASTDETAIIIRKYQQLYPSLIKPIFQKENQFSKGTKVLQVLTPLTKGKYIAICEGDDFWNDPKKLQIQVDFLEANPDYVISGHDTYYIDTDGKQHKQSGLRSKYKKDFDGEDLIKSKITIPTMSRVYRNVIKSLPPEYPKVLNGDKFILSLLGHYGKSKYHDDIHKAAYRVHSGGIWSMTSKSDRRDMQINTTFWMYKYYSRIEEDIHAHYFWLEHLSYVFHASCPLDLIKAFFSRIFKWGLKCDKRH